MLTVSLEGDQNLIAKLTSLPPELRAALHRKITELTLLLQRSVQTEHLSGPTGPHSLSVRTGALRASVFQEVTETASGVSGKVAYSADVVYAAIHEFGGVIHLPDIYPVEAAALHFYVGGQEVFAKHVAAHDVHMPERAPLRTSFTDMTPEIISELEQVVGETLRK
jgi:phage gpG-like protein